jgi:hypothetical protein
VAVLPIALAPEVMVAMAEVAAALLVLPQEALALMPVLLEVEESIMLKQTPLAETVEQTLEEAVAAVLTIALDLKAAMVVLA